MSSTPQQHQSMSILSLALAAALGGQAAAAAPAALEEVVVTAQKREESMQQTPISLAAMGSLELENKGISNIADLRSSVPNLQMTPHPNSGTTARVFMRGIGNNDDQITQDPSVAVYLDGVYVARSQGLAMDVADIERVEVLRGPQGSLYGRNATGGAINFISRAPEPGQFGFQQAFTVGSDNQRRARTQLNLPLGEQAAAQLTYLRAKKDGFIDNPGTGVSRYGDQDREAFRLAFNWQLSDTVSAQYSYDHSDLDDTPVFVARVPLFPRQGRRPHAGPADIRDLPANEVTVAGHNLTLNWDLSDTLALKSITGYRRLESLSHQRFHAGVYGPLPIFATLYDSDQHQFSQELQLVGEALDARLEYVAGLYYFDESGDTFDISDPMSPGLTERDVGIDNTAYAVFGQGTYTPPVLEDRLHITVGVRWSRDERQASMQTTAVTDTGPDDIDTSARSVGPATEGDNDFSNFSPSLILAYDIDDSVNVYGKIVKGYKTGGFNVRASTPAKFSEGFDEENLISYELGVKSQWWDDRLRLNAAVFRADYDDIQVSMTPDPDAPNIADVFNAGEATIDGAELELTARPLAGLTANIRYAYLDARYEKIANPVTGANEADRFYFIEAPRHSYSADLAYEFPATPIGVFTLLVDYSWQDEKWSATNDRSYRTDDYGLLNARLNLSEMPLGVGELRFGLWGRNLEDTEYYASHFPTGVPSAIFGDPRSYGIDVFYQY